MLLVDTLFKQAEKPCCEEAEAKEEQAEEDGCGRIEAHGFELIGLESGKNDGGENADGGADNKPKNKGIKAAVMAIEQLVDSFGKEQDTGRRTQNKGQHRRDVEIFYGITHGFIEAKVDEKVRGRESRHDKAQADDRSSHKPDRKTGIDLREFLAAQQHEGDDQQGRAEHERKVAFSSSLFAGFFEERRQGSDDQPDKEAGKESFVRAEGR